MKTLNTIQTLSKIGKIISKVIRILCIVGFCLSVAGIVSFAVLGETAFKLGGVTIHGIIEKEAGITVPTVYAAMATGAVFCAAEAVLCAFAERYFKNELADGVPFTLRGSKELTRLGVLTIVIPLCATVVCSIGGAIAAHFYPELKELDYSSGASVGLGVMMIVTALICRHGAELTEAGAENALPTAYRE